MVYKIKEMFGDLFKIKSIKVDKKRLRMLTKLKENSKYSL